MWFDCDCEVEKNYDKKSGCAVGVDGTNVADDVSASAQGRTDKDATPTQSSQAKDIQNKETPAQDSAKDTAEKPDIHEFVIANFKTESGVTLPQAHGWSMEPMAT